MATKRENEAQEITLTATLNDINPVTEIPEPTYKDRMITEYEQLKERADKLEVMLTKYGLDALDFEPDCPISLLELQLEYMRKYQTILEARAAIEEIEL